MSVMVLIRNRKCPGARKVDLHAPCECHLWRLPDLGELDRKVTTVRELLAAADWQPLIEARQHGHRLGAFMACMGGDRALKAAATRYEAT